MIPTRRRSFSAILIALVNGVVRFEGRGKPRERKLSDPRFANSKWHRRMLAAGLKGKC